MSDEREALARQYADAVLAAIPDHHQPITRQDLPAVWENHYRDAQQFLVYFQPIIADVAQAARAEGVEEGVDSTWHLKRLLADARAEAWDEGLLANAVDDQHRDWLRHYGSKHNPYRALSGQPAAVDHRNDSPPHTHGGTDAPECTTCQPAAARTERETTDG